MGTSWILESCLCLSAGIGRRVLAPRGRLHRNRQSPDATQRHATFRQSKIGLITYLLRYWTDF